MLTVNQWHDNMSAKALLEGFRAEAVLTDRTYDNNDLHQAIASMGAKAVISSTRSSKIAIIPRGYRLRNSHRAMLQQAHAFRRFATRYDRRAEYFLAFVHVAAICLWLR